MGGFGAVDVDDLKPWDEDEGLDALLVESGFKPRTKPRKKRPKKRIAYGELATREQNLYERNNRAKARSLVRALHDPLDAVYSERLHARRLAREERIRSIHLLGIDSDFLADPDPVHLVTLVLLDSISGEFIIRNPYHMTRMNKRSKSIRDNYNRLYSHRILDWEDPDIVVQKMVSEVGTKYLKRRKRGPKTETIFSAVELASSVVIDCPAAGAVIHFYFGTASRIVDIPLKWGWQSVGRGVLELPPEWDHALRSGLEQATPYMVGSRHDGIVG